MAPPTRICPSCDTPLPAEAAFCLMCGTKIGTAVAAPPADPLRDVLEQAVGNQYEITRLLGRGGMGAVYLAKEPALDRLVAIKVLPPESGDADTRERFRREARTAAKLTHPHIVPLHTFGEADGTMYFVMGFVQGESLGDLMRRKGTIQADDARRILAEIADALDYAHRQGIVHRDVKPDNILIDDESGKALLTDFGIAKAAASGSTLTEAGSVVGTVHYMSPEQAAGEKHVDGRSDLYSLGVIGYAMLAGRLPFDGGSAQEILVQHLTKDPVPLQTLVSGAHNALATALDRCLMKQPNDRWPDARRLYEALREPMDQSEVLPVALEVVAGVGSFGAGFALAAFGVALVAFLAGETGRLATVPANLGALAVAVILGVAWMTHRRKFPWKRVFTVMFRQPRSWMFWWPRPLRWSGDVWDRLPTAIRRHRGGSVAYAAWAIAGFAGAIVFEARGIGGDVKWGFFGLFAAVLFTGPVFVARLQRWGRSVGFSRIDTVKLLTEATSDSKFWRRPEIAAILGPTGQPRADPQLPQPTTAQEYLRAIETTAKQLPKHVQDLGRQSVATARQLAGLAERAESETGKLAKDADPSEMARLEEKLAILTEQQSVENEDDRQMRELVQHQLDLMRRLAGRLEAAQDRKTRMLDLLKTLWLQVADLRAQSAQEEFDSSEITDKISLLNEEIEIYVESAKETETILRSGEA